jgi:uncharacterized protein (TIGR02246 family)
MRSARLSAGLLLLSGTLGLAVIAAENDPPAANKTATPVVPRAKAGGAPAKKNADGTKAVSQKPIIREAPAAKPPHAEAEAAVHHSAKSFAEAYNRHDAKAISAGFTSTGELVTEEGTLLRGREAIEQHYAAVFAATPQAQIAIHIDSIRTIAAGTAIEEGLVESAEGPDRIPTKSHYMAVHVRQGDEWLVARARDFPVEGGKHPLHQRLKDLDFLTGEWLGEGEGVTTHTACRWIDGGNWLVQEFSIRFTGREAVTGSTRIGWDPQSHEIRSWTFDSDGGFSEARWTGAGHEWMLKSHGVTHLGRSSTATLFLKRIDATTLSWESRDRVEGGSVTPGIGPILVKRRPPAPAE